MSKLQEKKNTIRLVIIGDEILSGKCQDRDLLRGSLK